MKKSFIAGNKTDFSRGNLSPNLQARFCKLYPADFSIAISRTARFARYADERNVGCVYHRKVLFKICPLEKGFRVFEAHV